MKKKTLALDRQSCQQGFHFAENCHPHSPVYPRDTQAISLRIFEKSLQVCVSTRPHDEKLCCALNCRLFKAGTFFQCYLDRAECRRIWILAGNCRLITVQALPTSRSLHLILSLKKLCYLTFVLSSKSGFIVPAFLAMNVLPWGN